MDTINIGVVMDSINKINIFKDTTYAMLLEAQKRKYKIFYMEISDLYLKNNIAKSKVRILSIKNKEKKWCFFQNHEDIELQNLDIILMRKDPPVNENFLNATYILEYAENQGTLIINKPKILRNFNEKISSNIFRKYSPETIISCDYKIIKEFLEFHKEVILKPTGFFGGHCVFYVKKQDPNFSVIYESITKNGKNFCIAQKFLPEIRKLGDKRIFLVDGEPIPYCFCRFPKYGEIRSNLSAGGTGKVELLSDQDWEISKSIGQILKKKEIFFAGLDVIGKYLTEINITSPTCMQQIERESSISIKKIFFDILEEKIKKKSSMKKNKKKRYLL
ncbi:glutathione synthase [bacterium endosymbiont of Pedicinus badii]|uniref:glutathione synthase n=1 Tax=bacterium endosymbiont of Pedicinus badii TaxID=1719126 RepID=UPI0009B995A4|nr:glutathione synthase [bacterium endosymbiont of Pedicinus badii]OQM34020.1 glutathione synthetase [bacterium endosymbiont of Pedicinus badii]